MALTENNKYIKFDYRDFWSRKIFGTGRGKDERIIDYCAWWSKKRASSTRQYLSPAATPALRRRPPVAASAPARARRRPAPGAVRRSEPAPAGTSPAAVDGAWRRMNEPTEKTRKCKSVLKLIEMYKNTLYERKTTPWRCHRPNSRDWWENWWNEWLNESLWKQYDAKN